MDFLQWTRVMLQIVTQLLISTDIVLKIKNRANKKGEIKDSQSSPSETHSQFSFPTL